MSLYDRGYMNGTEESSQYAGRKYSAVIILIAINVVVWVMWQFARSGPFQEFMRVHFLLNPELVIHKYYFQPADLRVLAH